VADDEVGFLKLPEALGDGAYVGDIRAMLVDRIVVGVGADPPGVGVLYD